MGILELPCADPETCPQTIAVALVEEARDRATQSPTTWKPNWTGRLEAALARIREGR